jgi:pyrroloquinoline quinone (PQQ) biosynthesis protein C
MSNPIKLTNDFYFNDWISIKEQKVLSHRGLSHNLFNSLNELCQDKKFLQISSRQIYHIVLGFPFHIAGAIYSTKDEDLLEILVRNLYIEVGGDKGRRHIDIYRSFLNALMVSIDPPNSPELWEESANLSLQSSQLYSNRNMGTKLGALFAFETMSSPMVAYWDQALRKVSWLTPQDYQFFTIHIDIELSHAQDIAKCCSKYWENPIFQQQFDESIEIVMTCLEHLWDRILSLRENI